MLYKEDIKCLKGKAELIVDSSILLGELLDIIEEDEEWDNEEDFINFIKELLADNIDTEVRNRLTNIGLEDLISYKIKLNGTEYE